MINFAENSPLPGCPLLFPIYIYLYNIFFILI
nr:MAG TPA: hypothetical protein [Caudoviricetes sp.]